MTLFPLEVKKKRFVYRVHGIQIDRLGLMVLDICTESRDIGQNVSIFAGLVWNADFGQFL